ncbi:hypothetical protein ILYODFUR_006478 [Ilyodon furcidens]|uniref:NADH dehydrogenase subunit 6 n=1 Tax=Ilyodon furcidens TaxID=33524 RepID=A0ABV0U369_9TELE
MFMCPPYFGPSEFLAAALRWCLPGMFGAVGVSLLLGAGLFLSGLGVDPGLQSRCVPGACCCCSCALHVIYLCGFPRVMPCVCLPAAAVAWVHLSIAAPGCCVFEGQTNTGYYYISVPCLP